jgi:hypothetical protein
MIDQAMAVLAQGWSGMGPQEKEVFLNLYDPASTGNVDETFVQSVLGNYQQIRRTLEKNIHVSFEPDHDLCDGKRLYFTDLVSLHVCPYFFTETSDTRKARTLIHENTHIALRVKDRPYYRPTSKAFAELTPRGPWTTQLPLIGPIVREIVASDTLYHPDTYAHFALAMSGQPGSLDSYLDQGTVVTIVRIDADAYGHGSGYQVKDSWLRP